MNAVVRQCGAEIGVCAHLGEQVCQAGEWGLCEDAVNRAMKPVMEATMIAMVPSMRH